MTERPHHAPGRQAGSAPALRLPMKLLTLLTLAVLFAGALAPTTATAAPARESVGFSMVVSDLPAYVCTNGSLNIEVSIYRSITTPASGTSKRSITVQRVTGVAVDANVTPKGLGSLSPDRLMTGFEVFAPGVADFTFKAGPKPGKVKLIFEGLVKNYWTGDGAVEVPSNPIYTSKILDLEVRKCKYKVGMTLNGGVGGFVFWTGAGDEAVLEPESETHFSGTAPFYVTEDWSVPSCSITGTVNVSPIRYTADLAGDSLAVNFTIDDWAHTVYAECDGVGAGGSASGSDSESTTVSSLGGLASIPFPSPANGGFLMTVERVEDESAAFEPAPGQAAWLPSLDGLFAASLLQVLQP